MDFDSIMFASNPHHSKIWTQNKHEIWSQNHSICSQYLQEII